MMKINSGIANLLKAFLVAPPMAVVCLCLSTKELALDTETIDSDPLNSIAVSSLSSEEDYATESMLQLTSVSQLTDVRPTD
ncbi:hypothetical protein [Leptothermofonsia sp. ETS-13]|uniref:hypothetical protein n=1 Tax=Leptothermofonsia sp. ETS-13 TaxID=3035696 RepID=UPI003B9FBA8E